MTRGDDDTIGVRVAMVRKQRGVSQQRLAVEAHLSKSLLRTGWQVYSYLFRDEHLTDPTLAGVTAAQLATLRECGTIMALNRVELDGHISVVGPAWMFPATARVVFDLDETEGEQLDELYHGTFFNEPRRIESVKAHAALGGRLVHGCQSVPDQSGGCVVPYGADIAAFTAELAQFKQSWIDDILAHRHSAAR